MIHELQFKFSKLLELHSLRTSSRSNESVCSISKWCRKSLRIQSPSAWASIRTACIPLVQPIPKSMQASQILAQLILWATSATTGAFTWHVSIIHILPCLHMDSFTSQTNTNWYAITLLSQYPVCHPSLPLGPYIPSLGNSSEKALTTPPTSVSVTLFQHYNFLTSSPTLTEGLSKAVTAAVLEHCFGN